MAERDTRTLIQAFETINSVAECEDVLTKVKELLTSRVNLETQ